MQLARSVNMTSFLPIPLLLRHAAAACCIFLACIIFQLAFWPRLAWGLKPRLARVPGPRLARWSRLWIAKALASGRSHEIWNEVNAKYGAWLTASLGLAVKQVILTRSHVSIGPVARIGPNHVITDDHDVTRRILNVRSGYVRGPWFDSIRIDPHIPNIVSERDPNRHNKIRSRLAPSVRSQSCAKLNVG